MPYTCKHGHFAEPTARGICTATGSNTTVLIGYHSDPEQPSLPGINYDGRVGLSVTLLSLRYSYEMLETLHLKRELSYGRCIATRAFAKHVTVHECACCSRAELQAFGAASK